MAPYNEGYEIIDESENQERTGKLMKSRIAADRRRRMHLKICVRRCIVLKILFMIAVKDFQAWNSKKFTGCTCSSPSRVNNLTEITRTLGIKVSSGRDPYDQR